MKDGETDVILIAYAAPFAAFRQFTAGFHRPTFSYPPPSALYGLLLNLADIESRGEEVKGITQTRAGLPTLRLASALRAPDSVHHSFAHQQDKRREPQRGKLFQHQHTVPVGEASKERKVLTRGNKHHIGLASRGVLTGLRGVCAVDADSALQERLVSQLVSPTAERYGLPFLGDNNLFLEQLELIESSSEQVDWLVLSDQGTPMTLSVDRNGMRDTRRARFALQRAPLSTPPPDSWVQLGG